MIQMGVDDIAEAVGGTILTGKEPVDISDLQIRTVSSDSRDHVENGLFAAIRGERVDGHDFLEAAAKNGFKVALVDHEVEDAPLLQIEVDDTIAALGRLARRNIDRRRELGTDFTLIGITGSVGKTTTKDITKALLSSVAPTVAPVGSFNNSLGLPLTALKVDEKTRYFIAEMGANHLGEIRNLTAIAPPDVSVVLKVGTAHLGEFGSVENIFEAKSEIVEALTDTGIALLNSDDVNVARMAQRSSGTVKWFGLDQAAAAAAGRTLSITAADIAVDDLDRASFTVVETGQDSAPTRSETVHLSLSGRHNVVNALAAISIARSVGIPMSSILSVLGAKVPLSPHRMAISDVSLAANEELKAPAAHFTLIDDSFNANPDSMHSGIDGLVQTHEDAFHVAVLGPMLELGERSMDLHTQVGAYAIEHGVQAVVSVGVTKEGFPELPALAQALADGARRVALARSDDGVVVVETVSSVEQASACVARLASTHPDTVVLLKGSHASGLGSLAVQWTQDPPQGNDSAAMTATDGE